MNKIDEVDLELCNPYRNKFGAWVWRSTPNQEKIMDWPGIRAPNDNMVPVRKGDKWEWEM